MADGLGRRPAGGIGSRRGGVPSARPRAGAGGAGPASTGSTGQAIPCGATSVRRARCLPPRLAWPLPPRRRWWTGGVPGPPGPYRRQVYRPTAATISLLRRTPWWLGQFVCRG